MIATRDLCNNETTVNANDMKSFVSLSGYLESDTLNKTPGLPRPETSTLSADHGHTGRHPAMDVGRPAESTSRSTSNVEEQFLLLLDTTVNMCLQHNCTGTIL